MAGGLQAAGALRGYEAYEEGVSFRVARAPTYLTPANRSCHFCKVSCLIFDFSKHSNYKN